MSRLVYLALFAVLAVAVLFRCWDLGTVPGVNGDEVFLAEQFRAWLRGQPATLRAPTGRLVNVFHLLLVMPTELVAPAGSFVAPRIASLLCGLATCGLAFVILRRRWGDQTALTCCVLVSALPLHIAYSRLGWDICQTPLWSLLLLATAMSRRLWLLALVTAAAVLAHPIHIFLFPAMWGLMVGAAAAEGWPWPRAVRRQLIARTAILIAVGAAAVALGPGERTGVVPLTAVLQPRAVLDELTLLGRLFSGATVFETSAGPLAPGWQTALDIGFWTIVPLLGVAGSWGIARTRNRLALGLLAGTAGAVGALYVIAGTHPLEPQWERYGAVLTVPGCLCLSVLLTHLPLLRPSHRIGLALALAAALLLCFQSQYFVRFATDGGRGHPTFRTAAIEPKVAVMLALQQRHPSGRVLLVVTEFHLYWTLRYLTAADRRFSVVTRSDRATIWAACSQLDEQVVYFVDFGENPLGGDDPDGRLGPPTLSIPSRLGAPLLRAWQLCDWPTTASSAPQP